MVDGGFKIRNAKIIIISLILVSIFSIALTSPVADADDGDMVLVDYGNGNTTWVPISGSGDRSIGDVLDASLGDLGYEYKSGKIVVDGLSETKVGSLGNGGSLSVPGATGITVTSQWTAYIWNDGWKKADINQTYTSGCISIGFYPNGVVPTETPVYRESWTMVRGDATQTKSQSSSNEGELNMLGHDYVGQEAGVAAGMLYAEGSLFVKYNTYLRNIDSQRVRVATMACYTSSYDDPVWIFEYFGDPFYETGTPVIVSGYIYVPATYGYIFKMPLSGPGENNEHVTTCGNVPISNYNLREQGPIPNGGDDLIGSSFGRGVGGLVVDSGVIYGAGENGMAYALDLNLNLIWSYRMTGHSYYHSPTIVDGYLFIGAFDGSFYALDKCSGQLISTIIPYQYNNGKTISGDASSPVVFKENGTYTLMMSVSDGVGMSSMVGGVAILGFDGANLTLKEGSPFLKEFGKVGNYMTKIETKGFVGVYFASDKGIYRMDTKGSYSLVYASDPIKSPMTLVDGDRLYLMPYDGKNRITVIDLDGKVLNRMSQEAKYRQYSMTAILLIDGKMMVGNDYGFITYEGVVPAYIPPAEENNIFEQWWFLLALSIIVVLIAYYAIMRMRGIDRPFSYIRLKAREYLKSEEVMHRTKSHRRLYLTLLLGGLFTATIFIASLCIGYNSILSPSEMLSALWSALVNGVDPGNYNQIAVFESRLPRAMVALGVGISLSVAGCMYQAIIRNPLVDPYIMGVSAGAGTAAVAVIAFDFTFFGLFSPHSLYLTAFSAMVGGLVAFFATMMIAEKAGGSAVNYVLAGVVVGMVFSAAQTLMMSMAGNDVGNALTWLFGSFANISWNQVWILLIPALAMSLVPLLWAKEFNLVLLGEDQAQQMGLNVRSFNRWMLILASILSSLAVAFVGIIGFVGLVVPHLCRMILGGDHRLVLPASIAFGGGLMMAADLAARMLNNGAELPVGAITILIGVPMFAYLLIRRGRMYDG